MATLKLIREKSKGNKLGVSKLVIAETGELITGVQDIHFKDGGMLNVDFMDFVIEYDSRKELEPEFKKELC